jgi:hypothetical protein
MHQIQIIDNKIDSINFIRNREDPPNNHLKTPI